jgi:hypothetical protein
VASPIAKANSADEAFGRMSALQNQINALRQDADRWISDVKVRLGM